MRESGRRAAPRFDLLVSPVLVFSAAVLVVNDHVLKARWPGSATGKLSDVAGVAMIAIAAAALSARPRGSIVGTALGFTALKTVGPVAVAAAPILGGVTRTDPTDLVALVVLVPMWRWLADGAQAGLGSASRLLLPLKAVSLCGVVLATSATSCATDEVYRIDAVGGVLVATTDDGLFQSLDGGRTWTGADDAEYVRPDDGRQRSVCLGDGTCLALSGASVVRTDEAGEATEFQMSQGEREQLADADSTECGLNIFGSIAAVEVDDGEHVVVSMGVYGALHRSPAGVWEWVVIGDYGNDNPLAATGEGEGGADESLVGDVSNTTPFLIGLTLLTPIALALTAIPLARIASRNGRRAASGALPPLIGGLGLLVLSPIVIAIGAYNSSGVRVASVVLMVAIAVVIFSVTLAVARRPRTLPGPAAGAPLPSPIMP